MGPNFPIINLSSFENVEPGFTLILALKFNFELRSKLQIADSVIYALSGLSETTTLGR